MPIDCGDALVRLGLCLRLRFAQLDGLPLAIRVPHSDHAALGCLLYLGNRLDLNINAGALVLGKQRLFHWRSFRLLRHFHLILVLALLLDWRRHGHWL